MKAFPDVMLWAWERPEDLRSLDERVGVAFLVQTVVINADQLTAHPRLQPLRVAPTTPLIAVTRLEHRNGDPQSPHVSLVAEAAALIVRTATLPRVMGVQVDFDATISDRHFYRTLLQEVRAALGQSTPLSITALASWCIGDRWLEALPVDEVVPMLFRMGPANEPYRELALSRSAARSPCGRALGVSLDEPQPFALEGRRVYVFNPRPWNRESVADARHVARQ